MKMNDRDFMKMAYRKAEAAGRRGECPVGAVLVKDGKVLASAGNEELAAKDPTAHAEMLCLRRAGEIIGSHIFKGCTMYTTLWPCPMCRGAMLQAQVDRVVIGATAPRWIAEVRFNEKNLEKIGPLMQADCRKIFLNWAEEQERWEILEMEQEDYKK